MQAARNAQAGENQIRKVGPMIKKKLIRNGTYSTLLPTIDNADFRSVLCLRRILVIVVIVLR